MVFNGGNIYSKELIIIKIIINEKYKKKFIKLSTFN